MNFKLSVTDHVADRFIERVRDVPRAQAKRELIHLVEMAGLCEAPEWLPEYYQREGQSFSMISDGICACMMPKGENKMVLTTILIRGSRSETERRNRKRKQKEAKRKKRAHEQYLRNSGHRAKRDAQRRQEERER